jgi:hypothetical protein
MPGVRRRRSRRGGGRGRRGRGRRGRGRRGHDGKGGVVVARLQVQDQDRRGRDHHDPGRREPQRRECEASATAATRPRADHARDGQRYRHHHEAGDGDDQAPQRHPVQQRPSVGPPQAAGDLGRRRAPRIPAVSPGWVWLRRSPRLIHPFLPADRARSLQAIEHVAGGGRVRVFRSRPRRRPRGRPADDAARSPGGLSNERGPVRRQGDGGRSGCRAPATIRGDAP